MPVSVSDSALYMQLPSPVVWTGFKICNNKGWHKLYAQVSCVMLGNASAYEIGNEFNSLTITSNAGLIMLNCAARFGEPANELNCERISIGGSLSTRAIMFCNWFRCCSRLLAAVMFREVGTKCDYALQAKLYMS